ncbi:phage major capsid protein [Kerstersia gyiorum]|nr:phage major capsid protein [Kerstersia gyiorum]
MSDPTDVKALVENLNKAFEDFKAEHNKQLDEAKKGTHDALQALKVERINDEISQLQGSVDELNLKLAAGQMGGGQKLADPEYTEAFQAHFRKGVVQASMNKGAADEGGYLAPTEWDRTITDRLLQVSPIRSMAANIRISGDGFTKYFNNRGTTSGWVGEAATRPETSTPTLGALTYKTGEIYANPAATQQMLDDSEINLESWLAGEVETEFSYQEGIAFLTGDGTNKPNGLLTYVTGGTNATKHPWGAITTVNSGAAADIAGDGLLDLIYALPSEYTQNATLCANRSTLGKLRKLKDGQGNYLWQPSFQAGQPATLSGQAVRELAGLPDIVAGSTPIVFGDFRRGYLVVDRAGIRVLRDPYTNKPFVHFYTTKRVGGGLLNPDVFKVLKIGE